MLCPPGAFFWFVFSFSFSFSADCSLSLTGAQGPPLAHRREHPPGSFFFSLSFSFTDFFPSLTSLGPLPLTPFVVRRPCRIALVALPHHVTLCHVALASITSPSSCHGHLCLHSSVALALVALLWAAAAARLLGVTCVMAWHSGPAVEMWGRCELVGGYWAGWSASGQYKSCRSSCSRLSTPVLALFTCGH
jgi:hypothetical protein